MLILLQAWRYRERKFALFMTPFAALLIFATLYCRFHYFIDMLCALPMIAIVLWVDARAKFFLKNGMVLAATPTKIVLVPAEAKQEAR